MSGITDDANFIFKKVLDVVDATTGLETKEYIYDDVVNGGEVTTRVLKNGALDAGTPKPVV